MRYTVFDIEANGFLDEATKIWVISYAFYEGSTLLQKGSTTDYDEMRNLINISDTIVGHNIIRFDIPLMEKVLGIKVKSRAIDTLALSWYLFPEVIKHGLEEWGVFFGVPKPVIKEGEWLGPLPEETFEEFIYKMAHRCNEDVRINSLLMHKIFEYLLELYDNDMDVIDSLINYLMFKLECAREQEELGWRLNIPLVESNLLMFQEELDAKVEILSSVMPDNVKYRKVSKPAKLYKKDESLSKRGKAWLELLEDLQLPEQYEGSIDIEKSREVGNPNSHVQLKKWLFSLGWKPETYKFNKNKETGEIKQVPQVSLPFGAGICHSVKDLYVKKPELENLESLYVIEHRIGILKGFLRDVDDKGYIQARISGLTNTLRFKHTGIVNLPGYTGKGDWKDGIHIRGCLIAPEGYILCGSDMSSLEDRTKQHYMYYFDPEYVETMIKPGFDPHLDLAEFAYKMTEGTSGVSAEDVKFYKNFDNIETPTVEDINRINYLKSERHGFKTVNYSAIYGVGIPTMSRNTGLPVSRCSVLLTAYWEKNWSVKKIAKSCLVKTVNDQMWLFNPISKFWYSLRYDKDRFSTLNQGTGVFVFDNWVREVRSNGIKLCGQFHDEIIAPIVNNEESKIETERIFRSSIDVINKRLKLNRDMDIDVQFGNNYAEIH